MRCCNSWVELPFLEVLGHEGGRLLQVELLGDRWPRRVFRYMAFRLLALGDVGGEIIEFGEDWLIIEGNILPVNSPHKCSDPNKLFKMEPL